MTGRDENEDGRSGPPSFYRPKDPRPISIGLTTDAVRILVNTSTRTNASRSDVVEQLLRRFASQVEFPDPTETT